MFGSNYSWLNELLRACYYLIGSEFVCAKVCSVLVVSITRVYNNMLYLDCYKSACVCRVCVLMFYSRLFTQLLYYWSGFHTLLHIVLCGGGGGLAYFGVCHVRVLLQLLCKCNKTLCCSTAAALCMRCPKLII